MAEGGETYSRVVQLVMRAHRLTVLQDWERPPSPVQ
jgi:hypothetical protein